ncbi:MAG: glycosyltransferase family 1 protein [Chloroflexi bacterium]|nr:glycosyltransferase family 1 protein [Chloroflexota bacterium]
MTKRLKIAMISVHSCPLGMLGGRDTGGMNVYIQELARELGRREHAVDIYTMVHQPQHEPLINLGRNVRLVHLETGGDEEMPKVAIYAYIQRFACGVENFRKSNDLHYDLIHSHYWLSGLVGKQLQAWWYVPHVAMFHTLGAVKNSIGISEDEPELRIESEREVVGGCDCIIASTAREREELIKYYGASPDKITIIPCGVNLDLFKPIDKGIARKELGLDHQKVILFVGRIEPLKGLGQLLGALNYIEGEKPPVLMIVGGDEHSQGQVRVLQRMAKDLHIEDQVTFVGSVAQEKLPLFYSAADICAIPSYYESFGMVALESLACGTPIVATNVGGMRSIIRHGEIGRIARDNSPHNLASEISGLLCQREDKDQRVKTRRDRMTEFGWATIADRILREYDRLLCN